ncbi:hypothetical protein Tco_0605260 [Tanacetum coccineum]
MTSEATRSKEINETGINKNEPPRFEQDVQEKPHDDGVENKSSSIPEKAAQCLLEKTTTNLNKLDINIPFIEALLQIPKYAKYLKSLLTNKSRLEEACTETINERCSTVLLNELPSKEKDPMNFTIPCKYWRKHRKQKTWQHITYLGWNSAYGGVNVRKLLINFQRAFIVLKSQFKCRFETMLGGGGWFCGGGVGEVVGWADFVNYIVGKVVPPNWTFEKRKRFFSQVKTYFWEEPYAFKLCADNIMRRCVAGSETLKFCTLSFGTTGVGGILEGSGEGGRVRGWGGGGAGGGGRVLGGLGEGGWVGWGSVGHGCGGGGDWVMMGRVYAERAGECGGRVRVSGGRWCGLAWGGLGPASVFSGARDMIMTEVTNRAIKRILERSVGYKTLTSESRLMQLNELAKLRDGAYENTRIYKERTKKWHDSRLRGDKDFKSGPNIVKTVYPHGAIEITDWNGFSFKVNGQRLKKYYGGDIDKEDDEVIELENDATRS